MSSITTNTVVGDVSPKLLQTTSINLEAPQHIDNDSVLNTDLDGSGPLRLHTVPTFTDKHEERRWAKQHMAGAFRVFAKLGYADGASGHISLRDPVKTHCFWISKCAQEMTLVWFCLTVSIKDPYAMHFSKIRASDLVLVNEEGRPVEPTPHKVNAAGFIIHSSIHKARSDINAACHVHAPHGRAWSTFGKPIEMLNQDSCMFYDDLAVYEGFGGIVLAKEEGQHIVNALGPRKRNAILQNHGIITCGETMGEAAAFFIALERACANQLLVEAAAANGLEKKIVGDEEAEYTKRCSGSPACMYMQFLPEYNAIVEESNGAVLQ
ncbi:unnamed protein product [Clonostachys chloroleuca]|uniref:Class II aldolase/adducin N-terminal domain-containing protein n=1 Tax=Clonostachys chloroleuca TaxID=1926264 RepID=A0AA35M6H6_9HYPO|nr:unnamed protein product [Clonostachys chloroleuca]